ncbi:hypothetical protein [Paenibacillus solani]|uniref:hypothetical protein n=1 Tax=Paenibacillus solani TaxID=1705565 RepID=UPI003D2B7B7B
MYFSYRVGLIRTMTLIPYEEELAVEDQARQKEEEPQRDSCGLLFIKNVGIRVIFARIRVLFHESNLLIWLLFLFKKVGMFHFSNLLYA